MGVVAGTSFLAGAVLSLRLKVWAFIPAMFVASVVVGISTVASRVDLWSVAVAVIVALTAMQLGYLIGAVASTLFDVRSNCEGAPSRSSDAVERPVRLRHREGRDQKSVTANF